MSHRRFLLETFGVFEADRGGWKPTLAQLRQKQVGDFGQMAPLEDDELSSPEFEEQHPAEWKNFPRQYASHMFFKDMGGGRWHASGEGEFDYDPSTRKWTQDRSKEDDGAFTF